MECALKLALACAIILSLHVSDFSSMLRIGSLSAGKQQQLSGYRRKNYKVEAVENVASVCTIIANLGLRDNCNVVLLYFFFSLFLHCFKFLFL